MDSELSSLIQTEFFDLKRAFYLISRSVNDQVEENGFDDVFFSLVNETGCEIRDSMTEVEKMEVYNYFFFNVAGISPSGDDDHVCNWDPYRVMVNRRGSGWAVTFLYMLVARYVGIDFVLCIYHERLLPVLTYRDRELLFVDIEKKGKAAGVMRPFRRLDDREIIELYLERKTGIEPATLSLGS